MFLVDGKQSNISEEDIGRRNKIAELLQEWGLIKVCDEEKIKAPKASMGQIKIINYKEKDEWELCTKYNMGRSKK